jgi:hypothetical protein
LFGREDKQCAAVPPPCPSDIARRFDALDDDGKALVRAELVRAEDRMAARGGG